MVSIIIVNYNGKDRTRACLQSIHTVSSSVEHEIILIDNCSDDGSVEAIRKEYPDIRIVPQNANLGFGTANNRGARIAKGEFLFFVNNDIIFKEDIITPLKEFMEKNDSAGIAAPMLLNPDGTYQLSYGKYPSLLNELRTKRETIAAKSIPDDRSPKRVEWVSFAAVMIHRAAFEKIHGFDERYFMYFEDADFCCRAHDAGYTTYYCAGYALLHSGGGSWSGSIVNKIKIEYRRSQIMYYQKHRSVCEALVLRIYLMLQFIPHLFLKPAEERRRALSIIKMAAVFHANSPRR
jgi:GT2 family glycosyltransferase